MVFFNYALRKLNAKIVYYGPGLCGKTTNLAWVHDNFEGGDRGKMISLATEGDRTIFFDLLPLEIGAIRGMDVTLQLYTVPGQVHYNSTRQLVLRGADGVVFVADSQRAMQNSNIESFRNLQENLLLQGISLEGFPLALQFNKRDLKDVRPVEDLDEDLNVFRVPIFEAVATEGVGVQETLEGIVKLVMRNLRDRYEGAAAEARSPGAGDPAATMRTPLGSTPRTPASMPKPAPDPAPTPPPVEPPTPVAPVSEPPTAAPPPVQEPPPVAPTPLPVTPTPPPAAPAPPPVALEPTAAPAGGPSWVDPPVEEIVFPDDEGARTQDFSKTAGPAAGGRPPAGGFEDEVSTAVYDVGDEIGNEPEGVSDPPIEGDVFASPGTSAFVDEVTKTDVELQSVFESPPTPAEESPPEVSTPTETRASEPATPFDELSADYEEPEIEFMTDDSVGDAPPPVADLPPLSDRYVDRIVAPSPFAPSNEAAESADDGGIVGWTDEDSVAMAFLTEDIVVDESSDNAIEVPTEEPEYDVEAPSTESPLFGGDEDPFADPEPEPEVAELVAPAAIESAEPREVAVRAEDSVAMAVLTEDIVVDESSDNAIEVPTEEPEYDVEAPSTESPLFGGDEDPFADPEPEPEVAELVAPAAIESAEPREVAVRAEDNQLHLRLNGTGAILESGQVRELDIEVPVPGAWVGHRRVTLQLRLTLTPDSEEENGGSGETS